SYAVATGRSISWVSPCARGARRGGTRAPPGGASRRTGRGGARPARVRARRPARLDPDRPFQASRRARLALAALRARPALLGADGEPDPRTGARRHRGAAALPRRRRLPRARRRHVLAHGWELRAGPRRPRPRRTRPRRARP